MSLATYQDQVERFIAKNQLDKALKRLLEILSEGNLRDQVLILASQFAELENEHEIIDTLDEQTYTKRKNKLRHALLKLRAKLTATDLNPEVQLRESVLERLAVYCQAERQTFFAQLLDPKTFKHIQYLGFGTQPAEGTDVIIFDFVPEQETLLQQLILSDGPPVLIMVYNQLKWLYEPQYRDRYATANSIYSLGARLQELIAVKRWIGR